MYARCAFGKVSGLRGATSSSRLPQSPSSAASPAPGRDPGAQVEDVLYGGLEEPAVLSLSPVAEGTRSRRRSSLFIGFGRRKGC